MIGFGGQPADWIAEGGRPARVLGRKGMPSYEHDDGFAVFELAVAQLTSSGGLMLFPRWYGTACIVAPDGLVPLHHDPAAWWQWRPMIYRLTWDGEWSTLGSQQELSWRYGLMEMTHAIHADGELTTADANDRAERLLLECLDPQQRLDYTAYASFRVRGAKTGHVYVIELGDGFKRIDPSTTATLVSYCLHTEHWMPHEDMALATKFALEDPELELEALEGARNYWRPPPPPATLDERVAAEIETKWRLVA